MKSAVKFLRNFAGRFPAIHHAIRAASVPPRRIYQHLSFIGPFTVKVEPGISLKMISDGNLVENELFWKGYAGSWEKDSLAHWRGLASDADYILDVGANTGIYALAASALRPSAKVLAVEPVPRIFAKLQRNIELNGFSTLAAAVAASDRNGTATLYDFADEHEYSASLEHGMGGTIETVVPTCTLDSLLDRFEFPRIDLMKIDVERHEPAALRGMRKFLESCRPTILIEILDDDCRRGVSEALFSLDYEWQQISDERNFLLTPA